MVQNLQKRQGIKEKILVSGCNIGSDVLRHNGRLEKSNFVQRTCITNITTVINIICHHEHSVTVAKYIPKKYTQKCAYSLMINIQTFMFSKQKGFFFGQKKSFLREVHYEETGMLYMLYLAFSSLHLQIYIQK